MKKNTLKGGLISEDILIWSHPQKDVRNNFDSSASPRNFYVASY